VNTALTSVLLILTLLLLPVLTWFFGTPLNPPAWAALGTLLGILLIAWLLCFGLGEATGNVSQVDRLWSLLPILYVWVVAFHGGFADRLVLMSVLVSLWGIRLTWNFWRKGGYRPKPWDGQEDYRWQVLRRRPELQPPWKWRLFNLLFISGYQNVLILLMTLPSLVALQFAAAPLNALDFTAAAAMLFLIGYEAVADNQQWRFQSAKQALLVSGRPLPDRYAAGFLNRGLWARSRHPNYFAEQGVWIAFYLFGVAASGQWLNWSVAGCVLLVLLFQGSTAFTEEISAARYPRYREYQLTVPRFLPLGRRRS
jgi:steroid 5-alpha reductase family enzyme